MRTTSKTGGGPSKPEAFHSLKSPPLKVSWWLRPLSPTAGGRKAPDTDSAPRETAAAARRRNPREIASVDTARGAGLRLRRVGLPRHVTASQWARAAESLNAEGGATRGLRLGSRRSRRARLCLPAEPGVSRATAVAEAVAQVPFWASRERRVCGPHACPPRLPSPGRGPRLSGPRVVVPRPPPRGLPVLLVRRPEARAWGLPCRRPSPTSSSVRWGLNLPLRGDREVKRSRDLKPRLERKSPQAGSLSWWRPSLWLLLLLESRTGRSCRPPSGRGDGWRAPALALWIPHL